MDVVHHTTPSYYTIDAVCTNDFSQNKRFRGIRACGLLDAVKVLERKTGREFDRRWNLFPMRNKDRKRQVRALRQQELKARPRSPWAVLSRRAQGPHKRFSYHFDHHLNLAYECVMDRAMR